MTIPFNNKSPLGNMPMANNVGENDDRMGLQTLDTKVDGLTTDTITEGTTNFYFTNARARASISISATGLSYDSVTGIITLTTGYEIITTIEKATFTSAAELKTTLDALTGIIISGGDGTYSAITDSSSNWDTAYGWGDHSVAGYLTAETDPVFTAWDKSTGISITASQVSDFDTEVSNNTDVASNTTNNHTHSNKTTLDNIEEAFTTALKSNYDDAHTHSGVTTGNPHSVSNTDVGLGNVPNLDTTSAVNNDHTHSNKTNLDVIDQDLATSDDVEFNSVTTSDTSKQSKNSENSEVLHPLWYGDTANNTPTEIFIDGNSERFSIPINSAYLFVLEAVAKCYGSGEILGMILKGVIKSNAAGTTLIQGSVTTEVISRDDASWDVVATADNTNDALVITVTGESARVTNFTVSGTLTKVIATG